MSFLKKNEAVLVVYILPLLFLILTNYTGLLPSIRTGVLGWAVIIATFTYFIGLVNVFKHNIARINRKKRDWIYDPLFFIAFLAVFIAKYTNLNAFDWLINKFLLPMQIAMLGYVGMYFYTMYFRGARTRNWAATLVLMSAILTMLGNSPIGPGIWPGFGAIFLWIKDVPNTAGMRGLLIGMGLGIILTIIRTILGLERAYMGES